MWFRSCLYYTNYTFGIEVSVIFRSWVPDRGITPSMILTIIYPIEMAAFLWRPVMTRIFGIDRDTKRYSLLAGAVIGIGLMVLFS